MTSNLQLGCPAGSVKGNVAPFTENPVPTVCTPVMVTFLGPVLVNTVVNFELDPISTLPNDRFRGLTVTVWLIAPLACHRQIEDPVGCVTD